MRDRYRPVTFTPAGGGMLLAGDLAPATAGLANYVEKVNVRRERDAEMKREGWFLFSPIDPLPKAQPLNASAPVEMLAQFARPNGDSAIVAAAGDKLFRFFPVSGYNYVNAEYVDDDYVEESDDPSYDWQVIASGLAPARRWQVEAVNGYLVLNNGADLPMVFRVEWGSARPIYELREQGIVSVGEIGLFGTTLFLMDLVEISSVTLAQWFNNATNPYVRMTPEIASADGAQLMRTHFAVTWGHPGEPMRWAVIAPGSGIVNSRIFVTEFPLKSLQPNQDVVVIGGGLDGGNLTTRISQIASDGVTITLAAELVSAGSGLMRLDMVGSQVGRYDIEDTSARVLCGREFRGRYVIFSDNGYFVVSATGDPEEPYLFEKLWTDGGKGRVPQFPNSLVQIGDMLAYYSFSGPWAIDLRTAEPQPFDALSNAPAIWNELSIEGEQDLWAVDNTLTREVWFCTSTKTLCYDYDTRTVSMIDTPVACAAIVRRPELNFAQAADLWFLIGFADGKIRRYALGLGLQAWHRDGAAYSAVIEHGLGDFGDPFNEKDVRTWRYGHSHRIAAVGAVTVSSVVVNESTWSLSAAGLQAGIHYNVRARRTRTNDSTLEVTQTTVQLGAFTATAASHALSDYIPGPPLGFTDGWDQFVVAVSATPAGALTTTINRAFAPYEAPEVVAADVPVPDPDTQDAVELFDRGTYWSDRLVHAGVHSHFRLRHRTIDVMGSRTRVTTQTPASG